MTQDIKYSDIKAAVQGLDPASAVEVAQIAQLAVKKAGVEGKYFDGSVPSTSGAVFVPSARTYGGIMDAYNAFRASGAPVGTIKLQGDIYDISSAGQPIPWDVSGLTYEGDGWVLGADNVLVNGTVINCGNGTFDAFSGNDVDLVVGGGVNEDVTDRALKNMAIRKIGILNPRHGIRCGADRLAGAWYSHLEDICVEGNTGWGILNENWNESTIRNYINHPSSLASAIGSGAMLSVGSTRDYNQGNNEYSMMFSEAGNALSRGFLFVARPACNFNDLHVINLQRNNSGSVVTTAISFTSGSADITVADASKFPVGMQAQILHTWPDAAWNGLRKNQVYVVVSSNTATNRVRIADMAGAPGIVMTGTYGGTGSPNLQLRQYGFACMEIVGENSPTLASGQIQASTFHGLDLEGPSTCGLFTQNATVDIRLGFMFSAQYDANAASWVGRATQGTISSTNFVSVDLDQSTSFSTMCTLMMDNRQPLVQNAPVGLIRTQDGQIGINMNPGALNLTKIVNGSGGTVLQQPLSQTSKMSVFTTIWDGTTPTQLNTGHAGCLDFTGTASTSSRLPSIPSAAPVGTEFELTNASTTAGVVWTVLVTTGQPYNRQAAKTSVAIGLGQSVSLKAATDGAGGYFWKVTGTNGVTV